MSVKFGKGLYYKTDLRSYRNLYYHELMSCSLQISDKLGLEIRDNYFLYQIKTTVENTHKTVCNWQS